LCRATEQKKKPTRPGARMERRIESAYSQTAPPAAPGCPLPSLPMYAEPADVRRPGSDQHAVYYDRDELSMQREDRFVRCGLHFACTGPKRWRMRRRSHRARQAERAARCSREQRVDMKAQQRSLGEIEAGVCEVI